MPKTIIYFLIIFICFLFKGSDAFSQSGFPTREGIFVSEGIIQVYFVNRSLQEVLQQVKTKSGIEFKVPEEFINQRVSIRTQKSQWSQVLEILFQDFSKIEIWDGNNALTQVRLLESGENVFSGKADVRRIADSRSNLPKQRKKVKRRKPAWKCFSLSGKKKC